MGNEKGNYSKTIDFKDHKLGPYNIDTFIKDWGNEPRRGIKEKRCRIVSKQGKKALEITIPKGTRSKGGSFWRLDFPRNLTDATFSYDIMFGDDFDFVRGGKLPGLGGGLSNGFGATIEDDKNVFSSRLMWRDTNFEKLLEITKSFRDKM